jgi:hypothetical protein
MDSQRFELSRIRLAEPLSCGMTGCAAPTTSGLLEPDPQTRGLWRLLPICGDCSATLQTRRGQRPAPHPERRGVGG